MALALADHSDGSVDWDHGESSMRRLMQYGSASEKQGRQVIPKVVSNEQIVSGSSVPRASLSPRPVARKSSCSSCPPTTRCRRCSSLCWVRGRTGGLDLFGGDAG